MNEKYEGYYWDQVRLGTRHFICGVIYGHNWRHKEFTFQCSLCRQWFPCIRCLNFSATHEVPHDQANRIGQEAWEAWKN